MAELRWVRTRLWLVLIALTLQAGSLAQGQMLSRDELSPEEREQLYAEIDQEVDALERQGSLLKKVVRLVKPTVVHIDATKSEEGSGAVGHRQIEEAGSGVIIQHNEQFYILTNRHVIRDAPWSHITIRFADGRKTNPTGVWSDAGTDIAVMAVAERDLIPARLGDSNKLEIGDFVLAVGSPFGLSHSVTYGIISAKGRRDLELGDDGVRYQDFIQTDAAINPGNSGGPLLNLRGEVVGINTAIASNSGGNEGIGFTIPINMAMVVARQLIEDGSVTRAFLGVLLDADFGPDAARELGLPRVEGTRIKAVTPNSPAALSELKPGDVILQFDGMRIEDLDHLVNRVSLTPVGKEVEVLLLRDGQLMRSKVRVGKRSSD